MAPIDACTHLVYSQKVQIKTILLKALQDKADKRYQSAVDFQNQLSGIVVIDDDEPKPLIYRPQKVSGTVAEPAHDKPDNSKSQQSQVIHPDVHAVLETSLTPLIGPTAKVLKKASSLEQLYQVLANAIPDSQ